MIGRSYLERGTPVTVLIRWGPGGGPRNVLIRRPSGQLAVLSQSTWAVTGAGLQWLR